MLQIPYPNVYRIKTFFQELRLALINLLYPLFCASCGRRLYREFEVLCLTCETSLSKTNYHLQPDNPLELKFRGRCDIKQATALYFFQKKGAVQHMLFQLKYKGNEDLGDHLGELLGAELKQTAFAGADIILPVPLHPIKEKIRGYNQVHRFARSLATQLNVPCDTTILERIQHHDSQTKKKRSERWKQVENIFQVAHPEEIQGKRLILADDVITTGATIEACCAALKQAGAADIYVIAIAVTHQ